MLKKSLKETNPYLTRPEKYRSALITNVASSTAVETGTPVKSVMRTLIEGKQIKTKLIRKTQGSSR